MGGLALLDVLVELADVPLLSRVNLIHAHSHRHCRLVHHHPHQHVPAVVHDHDHRAETPE